MSRWLKATFASFALVLLCLYSFFPWEARADDIVITAGTSFEVGPFLPSSRYISWRARIFEENFGAPTHAFADQSQPVTLPCAFPCWVGSPSKGNTRTELFTTTPITSILHIEGQSYGKWFRGSEIRFRLDRVIIPAETASGFTRSTESMRSSRFCFIGYDLQTGFEPVTIIPISKELTGAVERYHYSLLSRGLHQRTGLTVHTSSMTGLFTFSKRTKPVVREYPVWVAGTGLRPMFASRIPVQFWHRIDPGDRRIVPATRLQIR